MNVLTHLHRIHRLRLADHAQVVLLPTLHVVLAFFSHGPGQPLPVRTLSLGRHGGDADFGVRGGVGLSTLAVAVVGLFALKTFDQVVAAFPTVEALEDGDPHGLHARLLFWDLLGMSVAAKICGRIDNDVHLISRGRSI